jgi:acetyl esterase
LELDPQAKALLDQLKAHATKQDSPNSARESIAAMRQTMSSPAFIAMGLASEPVAKIVDVEFSYSAGKVSLRLYIPGSEPQSERPLPAMVFYHGGGFIAGGLDSHDTLLRGLANRSGCIIVAVAYRLAPEHSYPAAHDDAWAALRWVVDHAAEIGADPRKIAVGGDSAGGLLAAWVAQKAAQNGPALSLQILLYPNLDATTSRPSWKELGDGTYIVSRAHMMEWFDAYLPPHIDRMQPDVSPLFASSFKGIAPALIVTADHDPLRDEGDEYAAKLKAAHIAVEHVCWPGMIHAFATFAGVLDAGKALIDQAGGVLRKAFNP